MVKLRYGINGNDPTPLRETGRRLGISPERVRQIESRALQHLATTRELEALQEEAKPLLEEARNTLASADAKALELGVTGACAQRAGALIEELGAKSRVRPQLAIPRMSVAATPPLVNADAQPAGSSSSEAAPASQLHGTPPPGSPAQLGSMPGRGR